LQAFAAGLEQFRLAHGLTQRIVARRAGISANYYQDIAHAQANPSLLVTLRLADAIGVSISELLAAPPESGDHRIVPVAELRALAAAVRPLIQHL
jgi:transcriptional regulator with XRE-family HTH domain